MGQPSRDLGKELDRLAVALGQPLVERVGVHQLHHQGRGVHLEALAVLYQPVHGADVGVLQLRSNRVFLLDLVQESLVLLRPLDDVLECPDLLGLAVLDGVQVGRGALADPGQNAIPCDRFVRHIGVVNVLHDASAAWTDRPNAFPGAIIDTNGRPLLQKGRPKDPQAA